MCEYLCEFKEFKESQFLWQEEKKSLPFSSRPSSPTNTMDVFLKEEKETLIQYTLTIDSVCIYLHGIS